MKDNTYLTDLGCEKFLMVVHRMDTINMYLVAQEAYFRLEDLIFGKFGLKADFLVLDERTVR